MQHVQLLRRGDNPAIGELVLRRENVLNAFNTQMARELIAACDEIAQTDVRVLMVRSSRSRAFCTGADLKERNGMTESAWRDQHHLFEQMFHTLADLPMPTIAVIDGYCLAGGMELALNCDLWVVSERAVFGMPEVTRGIMPGGGGTRLLSKRIGVHRAKEIILSGTRFTAQQIAGMGLFNRMVSPEALESASLELAETIADNAPLSVSYCKRAIDDLSGQPDGVARERELVWYKKCVNTEDRHEGVLAFNEKRKPVFKGR